MAKKVKVKAEDLRKYLNFCDRGMIYGPDVWESRNALFDALAKKEKKTDA